MNMHRKAFTMIELVFVIVILGILAAIAVPRLAATRDDAQIAKGRSDVAAIRAAIISERQTRLLRGDSAFMSNLGANFEGNGSAPLMMYPPSTGTGNGEWNSADGLTFTYKILDADNTFTYNPATGTFLCTGGANCAALAN